MWRSGPCLAEVYSLKPKVANLRQLMTSHLHFEYFNEPSPPPKTRTQSYPARPARKRKPESPSSASEPKTEPSASANTIPSGPTTARKAEVAGGLLSIGAA